MNLAWIMPLLLGIGVVVVIVVALLAMFKAFYVKVPQGTALIINDMSSTPKMPRKRRAPYCRRRHCRKFLQ